MKKVGGIALPEVLLYLKSEAEKIKIEFKNIKSYNKNHVKAKSWCFLFKQ